MKNKLTYRGEMRMLDYFLNENSVTKDVLSRNKYIRKNHETRMKNFGILASMELMNMNSQLIHSINSHISLHNPSHFETTDFVCEVLIRSNFMSDSDSVTEHVLKPMKYKYFSNMKQNNCMKPILFITLGQIENDLRKQYCLFNDKKELLHNNTKLYRFYRELNDAGCYFVSGNDLSCKCLVLDNFRDTQTHINTTNTTDTETEERDKIEMMWDV